MVGGDGRPSETCNLKIHLGSASLMDGRLAGASRAKEFTPEYRKVWKRWLCSGSSSAHSSSLHVYVDRFDLRSARPQSARTRTTRRTLACGISQCEGHHGCGHQHSYSFRPFLACLLWCGRGKRLNGRRGRHLDERAGSDDFDTCGYLRTSIRGDVSIGRVVGNGRMVDD